jgi:prevent-host-death family protein
MAHYSVATTKDKLSSLIDKALAGEEVVITRHGKPTVEFKIVQEEKQDRAQMMEWLRERRESRPAVGITALELKRLDQEDYER